MNPDAIARLNAALQGRYRVESELGEGGMARVYLATDVKHGRDVALKVLKPELGASLGTERFLREIDIAARLSHPHILPLFDSGQVDGLFYLVMPYVEGESLRDRLDREGSLPLEQAVTVASEIADALAYAHERGLVHRDIKPENILFDRRGHVKLADFGLAKLAYPSAVNPTLTLTRQALGTPHYMAPEQWESPQEVDHRADIYALGVVGYEMLTGRLPVGKFDAPSTLTKLPAVVDDVIHKALHRDPDKRYQEARRIQNDLAPALSNAPQKAWVNPFGKNEDAQSLKRWEAAFRDWANEYWPSQSVRGTLKWTRDEIIAAAKFVWRGVLSLPWGAIAGFFLILGMVNADWVVGQAEYQRSSSVRHYDMYGRRIYDPREVSTSDSPAERPEMITYWQSRGYDGFQTLTKISEIRVENYWLLVAAGGILFLALFRPIFGPKADLLAMALACYGILHILTFFDANPEQVISESNVKDIEYRAAPLIVGLTFGVLLISLIWGSLFRIYTHFQSSPQGERRFLRSFYESLLGLPPNRG